MKKTLFPSLVVEMIIISLFFSITSSVNSIENKEISLNTGERFLVDSEHNSENAPDEHTVFQSVPTNIKDLIQTQIGTRSDPMDSPWPVASHDVFHTGRSPYSTAAAPLVEKWRFPADGWIYSSPVIDKNGTIYFSGNKFFAVSSNGMLKWKTENFLRMFSAPAIDEQGIIYAGAEDSPKYFYAFDPNGTEKWRYSSDYIHSSPVIDQNGSIYFGEDHGNLIALYPNGTLKWSNPTIYSVYSSPAIGDDGTIYCTSWYNNVYAIYPNNGTVKWQFPTGGRMKANPSIADDGTIYVSSWDDYLYALYPNGTMKWRVNTYLGSSSNPSIGPDGTIYVAHVDLYAVNPDGTVKWIFPLGDERHCSFAAPAISADGIIYIGANIGNGVGGELIVVNPDGTERWRSGSICNEGIVSSPAIAEDGTVYIGSLNDYEVYPGGFDSRGYLHAFGPGTVKKASMVEPQNKIFYFFGIKLFPVIFKDMAIVIGKVTVSAEVTGLEELDHLSFLINDNIQYNCTEPPFIWEMNKDYDKRHILETHLLRITAFYKGGCESTESIIVGYIHFLRN